jgi:hypothetical protein
MLGRVTINSCAENYRFFTLFSQVDIDFEFGANGELRRIGWRCAKFLAGAKLSMAKFGASALMRQTFLEMRDMHLLGAPNLTFCADFFFLRHIWKVRATCIC